MKNTKIPLDIIWIDKNKRIVTIKDNFLPCFKEDCPVEKPSLAAKYVLEINGGLAKKLNIRPGDKADFL